MFLAEVDISKTACFWRPKILAKWWRSLYHVTMLPDLTVSFRISSVLSNVEPEPDRITCPALTENKSTSSDRLCNTACSLSVSRVTVSVSDFNNVQYSISASFYIFFQLLPFLFLPDFFITLCRGQISYFFPLTSICKSAKIITFLIILF